MVGAEPEPEEEAATAAASIDGLGEFEGVGDGGDCLDAATIPTLEKANGAWGSPFPTTSTLKPVAPAIAGEPELLTNGDGVESAALTAEAESDAAEL